MSDTIYRLNFMHYEKNNKKIENCIKYSFDYFMCINFFSEQECFKILSYLYDLISNEEKHDNSYKLIYLLNDILDIKILGFTKLKNTNSNIKELFEVVEVYNKSVIFNKKFILNDNNTWYIPNVCEDDIVNIYNKYNIVFDNKIVSKRLKKKIK